MPCITEAKISRREADRRGSMWYSWLMSLAMEPVITMATVLLAVATSTAATSPAMIDAQKKKPKVPVHAVMTARQPMVRFIGGDDMAHNRELFRVWLQTLPKWHQSGTPWLFLHTPDIAYAPTLVDTLWSDLRTALPAAGNAPSIPQQSSLF